MSLNLNYAFLATNNRGTGVYNIEKNTTPTGGAVEIFEDCLLDLNAWIEFALNLGYKNIILEGHSFGTNKIQYYLQKGKFKDKINSTILLGFNDSFGGQLEYLNKNNLKNEDILAEAKSLVSQGKGLQLLTDQSINFGELPQTAGSYISFMSPHSNLSKILPLSTKGPLIHFSNLKLPILAIVGDRNEYTVISPGEAVDLLSRANKRAKVFLINDCDHSYLGREKELTEIIKNFILEILTI